MNWEMVLTCLYYSRQAYDVIPAALRFDSWWHSTTAWLIRRDDFDVLVFRGSQQRRDWLINAQALPWSHYGAYCHLGFLRQQRSVWADLWPFLTIGKPLWITGHSLGGGVAEITAHELALREYWRDGGAHLVTFGKPNVWFRPPEATRLAHLDTQLSVVAGSDVVARIPRVLYGPDSGQMMLYFGNDGGIYLDPTAEKRRQDWKWDSGVIRDHSLDVYETGMLKLLQKLEENPDYEDTLLALD